ncbi:auxin-responsive protein SAUR67-like [Vitis riparia]|uniref:auxin-responsive protein SAUR67-like n=1 Tax=Vitis riparia TaxID=96939 RepID=UPI00155AFB2E|nr:auxin-responsive protein SAUR67-like [Vitis riparia]
MISPKKLNKMARKWQRIAALGRKRISSSRTNNNEDEKSCITSVENEGHFVVYTADQRRFMIPLVFLSNNIFRELFRMSEEEFGLPSNGPITLPYDSVFMEYIIPLIQRGMAKDIEKALLFSIATSHCSLSSSHQGQMGHQLLFCGY